MKNPPTLARQPLFRIGVPLLGLAVLAGNAAGRDEPADRPAAPVAPPATEAAPPQRAGLIEALKPFGTLVGEWRGSAQPVRGSTKGAWLEQAEWSWSLTPDAERGTAEKAGQPAGSAVGLRCTVKDGQLISGARLWFDPAAKQFQLDVDFADKTSQRLAGTWADEKKSRIVLLSTAEANRHRITLTLLNEKRSVLLVEQQVGSSDRYARRVEIGYTRAGTSLAREGVGGPECIVTGGLGTMEVSYKGKTYWVCCTGCRDAFNDDPEGVLAEAAERAKKKAGAR